MKKLFIHGILAGLLSAIASVMYLTIYQEALGTNFNSIVNTSAILGGCIIGCLLMTVSYAIVLKYKKQHLLGWLNILIVVFSFVSILGAIGVSLPFSIENPELFPGLVIPMHFFPALVFFAIYPFFQKGDFKEQIIHHPNK
ncbi:MAG: hypothetical protein AB8B78_09660 [Polaribacter sp.]